MNTGTDTYMDMDMGTDTDTPTNKDTDTDMDTERGKDREDNFEICLWSKFRHCVPIKPPNGLNPTL
jgi:hypothetical protein